jgi:HEAT repeat protein
MPLSPRNPFAAPTPVTSQSELELPQRSKFPQKIERAIAKLKSLQDGDAGVIDAIACGRQAVPALRQILFERERSGLYQTRCRTVEALGGLGDSDVLIEFLETDRIITDPVERVGEDAVINAAARALPNIHDPHVFALLLRLARHAHLTGVIRALGTSGRAEAVPALIAALEDDASRPTAETALRSFGRRTKGALLNAATMQLPVPECESPSSVRRRRSALNLLAEIGVTRQGWAILRHLIDDPDAKIATLACETCLKCASTVERVQSRPAPYQVTRARRLAPPRRQRESLGLAIRGYAGPHRSLSPRSAAAARRRRREKPDRDCPLSYNGARSTRAVRRIGNPDCGEKGKRSQL